MRLRWTLVSLSVCVCLGCFDESTSQVETGESSIPPSVEDEQPAESVTRQIAKAGVEKSGRSLDDQKGVGRVIAQPAKTLLAVPGRMVFEVKIPHAMNLYKATNGRLPQSHEEFMEKIIEANSIKLPVLMPDQKYVYDPKTGQLMVEGPAK